MFITLTLFIITLWNPKIMISILILIFKFLFGPRQANLVLIAYASSEGSGEPVHPRSLAGCAVLPEPSLLAHISSESRGTFIQKARYLALLNGWACAVKICHDRMLEDTNSLDGAHFIQFILSEKSNVTLDSLSLYWVNTERMESCYVLKQHSYLKNSAWKLLWRLWMPTNSQIYGEGTLSKIALWCYVIRLGNLDLSIKNLDETETV